VGLSLTVVGVAAFVVQGLLVRVIVPKLGPHRSVYVGLGLYALGYFLYALATRTWMMFTFTAVYSLGGITGPALQGLISGQVPSNEQGELQGALTSLMSLTAIGGPLIMTNVFAWFTSPAAPIYLPGAAMLLGSFLTLISAILARSSLKKTVPAPVRQPVTTA
jgi:DHA1 family tetracycline resistance protein-like MFS transporter